MHLVWASLKLYKHAFFDLLAPPPKKEEPEIHFLGKVRPREIRGNCLRPHPHSKSVKEPETGVKGTWPITLCSFYMGPPISGKSSYLLMAD